MVPKVFGKENFRVPTRKHLLLVVSDLASNIEIKFKNLKKIPMEMKRDSICSCCSFVVQFIFLFGCFFWRFVLFFLFLFFFFFCGFTTEKP